MASFSCTVQRSPLLKEMNKIQNHDSVSCLLLHLLNLAKHKKKKKFFNVVCCLGGRQLLLYKLPQHQKDSCTSWIVYISYHHLHQLCPLQPLSYMKVIFSVDICSLASKVYHYILVIRNSSLMQWSQLTERRDHKSKSGLEQRLKISLIERKKQAQHLGSDWPSSRLANMLVFYTSKHIII